MNDGVIVDIDGTSNGVNFSELEEENYYLVLRHRNHLAVISKDAVNLQNTSIFDFSIPSNVSGGESQLAELGDGRYGLFAGDFDSNGVVTVDDFNLFNSQMATLNQYLDGDVDFDRAVTVSDYNLYRENVDRIGVEEVRY